jgi:hypothetical protein
MGRPDKKAALTLVMITGDESEHRYVANRILEEFDLEAIIVDRGRRHTRSDRLRYLLEKYTARQLLSRLLLRLTSVILLYVATIYRAHEGRLEGEHQDLTIGREYHAEDKRLRHNLFARWLLRSRKARKPIENVAIRQRDQ